MTKLPTLYTTFRDVIAANLGRTGRIYCALNNCRYDPQGRDVQPPTLHIRFLPPAP